MLEALLEEIADYSVQRFQIKAREPEAAELEKAVLENGWKLKHREYEIELCVFFAVDDVRAMLSLEEGALLALGGDEAFEGRGVLKVGKEELPINVVLGEVALGDYAKI